MPPKFSRLFYNFLVFKAVISKYLHYFVIFYPLCSFHSVLLCCISSQTFSVFYFCLIFSFLSLPVLILLTILLIDSDSLFFSQISNCQYQTFLRVMSRFQKLLRNAMTYRCGKQCSVPWVSHTANRIAMTFSG